MAVVRVKQGYSAVRTAVLVVPDNCAPDSEDLQLLIDHYPEGYWETDILGVDYQDVEIIPT